jgi:hypothetical protein
MAACWLLLTVKGPDMLEAGLQLAFRFFGGFFEITGQQFGGYGRVEKVLAPPVGGGHVGPPARRMRRCERHYREPDFAAQAAAFQNCLNRSLLRSPRTCLGGAMIDVSLILKVAPIGWNQRNPPHSHFRL